MEPSDRINGGFAALGRQRAGWGKAAAGCRSPFAYENMKPTSESLSLRGRCSSMVVECNCAAVKSCGEKYETKDQPQKSKDLNTLRPGKLTSRRTGEIGARAWVSDEVLGVSLAASRYSKHSIKRTCGGCRVCGVGQEEANFAMSSYLGRLKKFDRLCPTFGMRR